MRRTLYLFILAIITTTSLSTFSSCREDKKTPGEKVEESMDEAGDEIEDAVDDAGDNIEDAGDEIEDAVD